MATQNYQDRPRTGSAPRSSYESQRPTAQRPSGARPTGQRPAGQRPAGQRPAGQSSAGQRPAGQRPAGQRPSGQRPTGQRPTGQRPQQRRKKKAQGRFYAILAVLIVVVLAIVLIVVNPFGGKDNTKAPNPAPVTPVQNDPVQQTETAATTASHSETLAQMLASEDGPVQGLSADEMAKVSDLSINQNLPDNWMNVLLLGSDERYLSQSARTDTMIICSINLETGAVKLSSIMRDLAVEFDDIGKYNGTYRINSANYFGGEELAMKTVNECFGMNIDRYVRVNFYGFQQVAHLLGGIDIDITQAEMEQINIWIVDAALDAYYQGIDESNLPKNLLETYGPNTHLDGRQTLAYARIRKIDSDYARAERQRKVLTALMNKLKGAGAGELLTIGAEAMNHFKTNMTLEEILAVAIKVCGSGVTDVGSFRLPVNGTYVQEKRRNDEMFYDCDWAANSRELYNFIYTT